MEPSKHNRLREATEADYDSVGQVLEARVAPAVPDALKAHVYGEVRGGARVAHAAQVSAHGGSNESHEPARARGVSECGRPLAPAQICKEWASIKNRVLGCKMKLVGDQKQPAAGGKRG